MWYLFFIKHLLNTIMYWALCCGLGWHWWTRHCNCEKANSLLGMLWIVIIYPRCCFGKRDRNLPQASWKIYMCEHVCLCLEVRCLAVGVRIMQAYILQTTCNGCDTNYKFSRTSEKEKIKLNWPECDWSNHCAFWVSIWILTNTCRSMLFCVCAFYLKKFYLFNPTLFNFFFLKTLRIMVLKVQQPVSLVRAQIVLNV